MKGLKTGDAFKADTSEGSAKQMGVPADQLKKTIADYNAMVDQKKDPDFGKAERNPSHKDRKSSGSGRIVQYGCTPHDGRRENR